MKNKLILILIIFCGTLQAQSVCGDYDNYRKKIVYDSVYYSSFYRDIVRELLLKAYQENELVLTIKITSEGLNGITQIGDASVIDHPAETRIECTWDNYYGDFKLGDISFYNENGKLVSAKSIYPDGSVRYLFDYTVEPRSKIKYVQGALIPKIKHVNSFPAFFKKRYEKGELVKD